MKPLTILVVEDDAAVRNIIIAVLVREKHSVLEADSAAEALEVLNSFEDTIDLLIADHSLKTMTGREVAETIAKSRPRLKILHISGYPRQTLEKQGEIVTGAYFLAKPFLPKALIEKIREITASSATARGL